MLYLIAAIAGQRVAIPAESVESVVEIQEIAPVPCVASHIAGLAALRSRVLTIVDCAQSLGIGGAASGAQAVIVTIESHQYGLLVEDVIDVVAIETPLRAAPLTLSGGWARTCRGIVEHGDAVLLVLDVAALVEGPPALAA